MRIEAREVTKRYDRFAALEGVSFAIEPGSVVAIVGANGAGKTTLLRCLAGIARPDSGELRYDGELFERERLDLRRRLGMLADTPEMFMQLTTLEHLALAARLYGVAVDGLTGRVVEWLREVNLLAAADRPLHELSRGERYKAALIGLRTVDPELWLLDEPFASGLDPLGLDFLRTTLRMSEHSRTTFFTTQLLDLAQELADQIVVLESGCLVAAGTLDALRERAGASSGESLARVFRQLRCEGGAR